MNILRCASVITLSLIDGTYYEGYVTHVLENSITFCVRGPLAPEDPIHIEFNQIDMDNLCHFSETENKWKSARWDYEKDIWIITDWVRVKS